MAVDVASPRDYIQVTTAGFLPERPGVPNRLTVVINRLPGLGDRPCPVELVLPEDTELFPAFKGKPKVRSQAGSSRTDGRSLTLYAEEHPAQPQRR